MNIKELFGITITLADLRDRYRNLALRYHPDRGGDLETMKLINLEYESRLSGLEGAQVRGEDGRTWSYRYDQEKEREVMSKLAELLKHPMPNVTISLMGTWIWITGSTKPFKEALKSLGCAWSPIKGCWYWHPTSDKRRYYRGTKSLADIATTYGCKTFMTPERESIH